MKKWINSFLDGCQYFIEHYSFPDRSVALFRKSVYTILALKMLFLWPELDTFYRFLPVLKGRVPYSLKILYISPTSNYYSMFWLLMCAVVCAGIVVKRRTWLSVLIFAFCYMYFKFITVTTNDCDILLRYFTFVLIFIREGGDKGTVRQMVNNVLLIALQVSFCLLYFVNSQGKMILPFWQDGSFMSRVWEFPYYAQQWLIPTWFSNHWVALIMSWAVMLFEIGFALLIWFRPFKKWLFIIGILFHLGIALFLSLPDFGAIMIVSYFLFTQVDILKEIRQFRQREIH
ncbi:hypothetical protein ACLI1A_18845 [Flavobacterium sp. RHBU_3]|uniref:hypothetical protein n=1 Tax=Flavobacterium sp. RHBU_3 TaxID=3391184 RepID=UPI00398515C1